MPLWGDIDEPEPGGGSGFSWADDNTSGGIQYTGYTAPDGPYGGQLPAGTIYTVGSNGSFNVDYRPPTGGGGGGGNTSYTTIMSGQLGANRYTTYTDSQGNLWQIDNLDGSQSIIQRAPSNANPADKNNDGLDDTTNMALGVYKDPTSPSGYYYPSGGQLIPVLPNGAPYNGPDLYPDPVPSPTKLEVIGGQTGGYYSFDPITGKVNKIIPGYTAPSTSSGGGGSSYGGGGGSSYGGGGGGGGSAAAPPRPYAFQTVNLPDGGVGIFNPNTGTIEPMFPGGAEAGMSPYQEAQLALQYEQLGLSKAAAERQAAQDARDFKLKAAREFADVISLDDPLALPAFLAAGGGDVSNALASGATALSPAALLPAAQILQMQSGQPNPVTTSFAGNSAGIPGDRETMIQDKIAEFGQRAAAGDTTVPTTTPATPPPPVTDGDSDGGPFSSTRWRAATLEQAQADATARAQGTIDRINQYANMTPEALRKLAQTDYGAVQYMLGNDAMSSSADPYRQQVNAQLQDAYNTLNRQVGGRYTDENPYSPYMQNVPGYNTPNTLPPVGPVDVVIPGPLGGTQSPAPSPTYTSTVPAVAAGEPLTTQQAGDYAWGLNEYAPDPTQLNSVGQTGTIYESPQGQVDPKQLWGGGGYTWDGSQWVAMAHGTMGEMGRRMPPIRDHQILVGEQGPELISNPKGAPLDIANTPATMNMLNMPMVQPRRMAEGTYGLDSVDWWRQPVTTTPTTNPPITDLSKLGVSPDMWNQLGDATRASIEQQFAQATTPTREPDVPLPTYQTAGEERPITSSITPTEGDAFAAKNLNDAVSSRDLFAPPVVNTTASSTSPATGGDTLHAGLLEGDLTRTNTIISNPKSPTGLSLNGTPVYEDGRPYYQDQMVNTVENMNTPATRAPSPIANTPGGVGSPSVPLSTLPQNPAGYGVSPLNMDQLNIDPALIPYMEQVLGMRTNAQMPNLNPYDITWDRLDPVLRNLFLKGRSARTGLSLDTQLFDIAKNRLQGAGRPSVIGY